MVNVRPRSLTSGVKSMLRKRPSTPATAQYTVSAFPAGRTFAGPGSSCMLISTVSPACHSVPEISTIVPGG